MVVIIIMSVILSFVTLSIGDGGQARELKQEAQRLASLLKLAREEAVMQAQEIGISFDTKGYHFYVLQQQKWQIFTKRDDIFHPHQFSPGIQSEIHVEGEPVLLKGIETNAPQLLLLSSGELTPFEVILSVESDETLHYRLRGTAIGVISIHHDKFPTSSQIDNEN